jgi:hypothetical protein
MPEIRGGYKRLERARPLLEALALNASSSPNAKSHCKDLEEKPKFALDRNLWRFVKRLLIHVISLALTLAVIQLSFRGVYWFDIGAPHLIMGVLGIGTNEILNGLQFVAKIHEVLMVCSLSAIVLQGVRLRLVGRKGLPLGLLTSAYNVGSVEYLKSKAFWVTGFRRTTWIFGAFIASITLLASLLGPSSAIAIIPNLDWWPVPHPFPANMLPVYVPITFQELWPLQLSPANQPNMTWVDCDIFSSNQGCPSAGYEAIQLWAGSYVSNLASAEISMVDPSSNSLRILSSIIPGLSSQYGDYVAVSTSPSSFASTALGSFWDFVSEVESLLDFNRPRLRTTPSQQLYQPLVQASCDMFILGQESDVTNQNFSTSGFDNFFALSGRSLSWPVPDWLFNYNYTITNQTKTALSAPGVDRLEFGSVMNFSWVNLDPSVGGSIGALVIAPYMVNDTNSTGVEILGQGGAVYGCTVDARWASTQLQYDPVSSQIVQHNLTSLFSQLANNQGGNYIGNYIAEYGIGSVIQIDTSWANQLNPFVKDNGTAITAFEGLFAPFISDVNVTSWGPSPNESLLFQFSPPTFVPNSDLYSYLPQSANTIAVLISLMVTDGLARIGSDLTQFVRSGQINSTWSSYTDIRQFIGPSSYVTEGPTDDLTDYFSLYLEADRYGYGYGITSPTVQFGIAVLLTYAAIVTIFLSYISYDFFYGRGWTSSIWGELQEFIALAINSQPTTELENTCAGIEQTKTWQKNVRVREVSENHLGLVVGAPKDVILGVVMQGKEYGTITRRMNVGAGDRRGQKQSPKT